MKPLFLIAILFLFNLTLEAQVSKTINAALDTLITSLPPIHKEKLKILFEDISKSGLYNRIDTTKYDTMYFKYSICFLDSNTNESEYFFCQENTQAFMLYYFGKYSKGTSYDLEQINNSRKLLLKTNKNLTPFQTINYEKPQETGTGCICYSGLSLLRIKMQAKRRIKKELKHTYQIQINVINAKPFVSVQIPAKHPHFKVHVNCGKF